MTTPPYEPPPASDPQPYPAPTPGYGPAAGYGYGAPGGYGIPPQQPYYPYPVMIKRPYEGLAIASLVLSCAASLGLCTYGAGGVLGIVGAILGHVARSRIRRNAHDGNSLALAGIIVGWSLAALSAVILAGVIVVFTHSDTVHL